MRKFNKFFVDNFFNIRYWRNFILFFYGKTQPAPAGGNLLLENNFDYLLEDGSNYILLEA